MGCPWLERHDRQTVRMGLVLVVIVCAVALTIATGGRLYRLARVHVRGAPVLVAALAAQLVALLTTAQGTARFLLVAFSLLCAAAVINANWRLPGVPLLGAGLLLNTVVMTLNGAMPVSLDAAARAGVAESDLRLTTDPAREEVGPDTRLHLLGDVVPLANPVRREVVSPGDVLVAAGAGMFVVSSARRPAGPRRRRQPSCQRFR